MLLSFAFGTCPPPSSLRLPPWPSLRPTSALDRSRKSRRVMLEHAFILLLRSFPPLPLPGSSFPLVVIAGWPASSACAARQVTSPLGPFDAFQSTLTRPSRAILRPHAEPAGVASPSSSRVVDLPALFHAGSSMGTRPSEVSPRALPPDPLGPRRPPCRFPPCGVAAPRISASSSAFVLRLRLDPLRGCVLQRRRCSRHRWVAPLLVVSPLRG